MLEPELHEKLRRLSYKRRVSIGKLIREAIAKFLGGE